MFAELTVATLLLTAGLFFGSTVLVAVAVRSTLRRH